MSAIKGSSAITVLASQVLAIPRNSDELVSQSVIRFFFSTYCEKIPLVMNFNIKICHKLQIFFYLVISIAIKQQPLIPKDYILPSY